MLHVVIMAGGKGTRFWPLSKKIKAKQFLNILGNKSLLKTTIERLHPLIDKKNIWIVTNQNQKKFLLKEKLGIPTSQILYEPIGKNTAPCIGWAAFEIIKKDPKATMIVLPSDHLIKKEAKFRETLKTAVNFVKKNNCLMTIGIKPTFPHTGYGYIEIFKNINKQKIEKINTFKEKPDFITAQKYVKSEKFLWNSGMFIWQASKILELIEKYMPTNYQILAQIAKTKKSEVKKLTDLYQQLDSISIDYGIMEKAIDQTYLIESSFIWNDIGNWISLEEVWPQDHHNNAKKGKLITLNSKNNITYSEKKLIALIDVENLIVVESEDAILVLPKKSHQKIKELYENLDEKYT
ncbi:mannose-1-phosphate guanylyltransferase [bacterium]|jgi:mannose-1-phosphate guanylyltransferase|nr:mannose-1-phosphate guanylyltransferase [bacterium]